MFTADEIKSAADAAFKEAESLVPGGIFVKEGLVFANRIFDNSPLPQLIADKLNSLLGAKQAAAAKP